MNPNNLKRILAICLVLPMFCVVVSGCSREYRPKDLPKLYPCLLKFTQEGKPLEDARISLKPVDPTFTWTIGGYTDSSGEILLVTHGKFLGVPEGKYKIVVSKEEEKQKGGRKVKNRETDEMTVVDGSVDVYTLVSEEYGSFESTPLTFDMPRKKIEQEFDCGKAIRKFLKNVSL